MNIPDRIYAQYRDKPKAVAWLSIAREMGGSIEDAALAVKNMYDIDSNVGAQLDIIGRIVVIDRNFIGQVNLNPLMFSNESDGAQCGDDGGGFSAWDTSTDSAMSDELFRIAIKAKIMRNNGDATIESILRQVSGLLHDISYLQVIDGENMTFSIDYIGVVSSIESWALLNANLIQKPQGVRFLGFNNVSDVVMFGDDVQFGDDTQFTGLN